MSVTKSSSQRKLDTFIGPGATRTEVGLQFIPPTIFSFCIIFFSAQTPLRKAISSILAFDLLGGVLTNATTAAKRWYHRPDRTKFDHLKFVAPHVLHLALVAAVFRNMDFSFFFTSSTYLALASVVIVSVDRYIRTPVAMLFYCGAVLLGLYFWKPTPGVPWFVPLFFLKLLISHLLPS